MDGLGQKKGEIRMYRYFEDKDYLKKARSFCSKFLEKVKDELRLKYSINSEVILIGSGARNMVTENAYEGIDFDYNFNIISCPNINDCKYLKTSLKTVLNKYLNESNLGECSEGTASLTTKKMSWANSTKFSMDVAIVSSNSSDDWFRLIQEKTNQPNRYYWNIAPNSKKYSNKAKELKTIVGAWDKVHVKYLELKNMYLSKNDTNHPSFICYIEAINAVYNHYNN